MFLLFLFLLTFLITIFLYSPRQIMLQFVVISFALVELVMGLRIAIFLAQHYR